MTEMPVEVNERIAYLTAPSGRKYQVLNEAGNDWDEAATKAAYDLGEPLPEPEPEQADTLEGGAQ